MTPAKLKRLLRKTGWEWDYIENNPPEIFLSEVFQPYDPTNPDHQRAKEYVANPYFLVVDTGHRLFGVFPVFRSVDEPLFLVPAWKDLGCELRKKLETLADKLKALPETVEAESLEELRAKAAEKIWKGLV
jgi:hypothetical protein